MHEILTVISLQALHYDIRRGPHSVGSHVRDAAAYVCWAFGRAYYHNDMKNILKQLAPHLLAVACYDREVLKLAYSFIFLEEYAVFGNQPSYSIASYFEGFTKNLLS